MKPRTILANVAVAATISVVAYAQMGMMGGGMMGGTSARRHQFAMMNGVDVRYAGKSNPLRNTPQNVAAGKALYERNCAMCHGPGGRGDGPAGKALSPPPADIATFTKTPMATDGYLYWTIAEGGVPVGSAMPPFKATLKDPDIWKLILYVRRL